MRFRSEDEIKFHLYTKGFQPNYWVWSSHGESFSSDRPRVDVNQGASSNTGPAVSVAQNYHEHYPFNEMNDMITDVFE
jgi:hypothetical protein